MKLPTPNPTPVEEKWKKICEGLAAERINLYFDLKKVLGEEKGTEVFKRLYDEGIQRIRKNFPGGKLPVGDLMRKELTSFPMLGFELTIDEVEEGGEKAYYEHLTNCPFLNMAKKMKTPELPCDFLCSYDVELAIKDKRGRWEIKSRMGDGASECVFKIKEWKD
ncbi:MAG: L-2-amino-thiazoline-4-carboxylic acid hydrolase [Candidatus Schekmanbacteria bacterium]|nr:L-2-amino-thiazoline-4-carboxylic acid hydrolase [Candidatus Schekmanbacteria bacterium]